MIATLLVALFDDPQARSNRHSNGNLGIVEGSRLEEKHYERQGRAGNGGLDWR